MPIYTVRLEAEVTDTLVAYVDVEAADEDRAKEAAEALDPQALDWSVVSCGEVESFFADGVEAADEEEEG